MFSRNVHALVCSEHAVVLHLSHNGRTNDVHDLHVQFAVVEENVVSHLHVLRNVGIAKVHDVMTGVHVRASENLHHVTGLIFYRLIHTRRADLRTFRIYHQSNVRRHRSHISYYSTYPVWSGMGSIHADHIHSSEKQLANEVNVTPAVTDRSNNLCLFHLTLSLYVFSTTKLRIFIDIHNSSPPFSYITFFLP